MAEITALQAYQKEILTTLDAMVIGSTVLTVAAGVGGGSNNGLGTFSEAASLSSAYNEVMQTMITNFREITDLVTAMANVLGTSAQNYSDTEAQLTAQFNQIVTQYESQSGGFSTPGSPTTVGATIPTPQGGTSSTYQSAIPDTSAAPTMPPVMPETPVTPATPAVPVTPATPATPTTPTGSISQDNNANQSADTNSEM
jgi:hypothetical protein